MPSISVIVPVYKVEPYLRRCVDSILRQTFREFELILVDDGSPDRCGEICEEYVAGHSFIHVIHRENGGLSAARNSGIDWAMTNSESRYLAFVDSDDWVAPEYLEMLYRAVMDTGCAISACGLQRTAGEALPAGQDYSVKKMAVDDYYCSGTVHDGITAVACSKLYRKDLFAALRYPVGKLHEDEFTTYRLVYGVDAVAVVPAKLYAYFQNGEGIMLSAWNPRRMHALEAGEQQIQFAKEKKLPRFLDKAVEQYIYSVSQQLSLAEKRYHKFLRRKLRWGLTQGRRCGVYPFDWDALWAYELAYPMAPVWWLVFKIKAWIGR